MWKCLVATVALLVAVAKSVSLDNDVDQSQSKMLLQHVKRDTDTCQDLGEDCKKPMRPCGDKKTTDNTACRQQDCCEGLTCHSKGLSKKELRGKIGVCKKNYLDYDNKCTTEVGGRCIEGLPGHWVCRMTFGAPCTITCCKGLTCSSKHGHTCQPVKRDTDTCQGLGDDCKKPKHTCRDTACAQQDCCEGLACKFKEEGKTGVCKKDYLDYDNKCSKAGGKCVKSLTCRGPWPTCGNFCCEGLTCTSNVCE